MDEKKYWGIRTLIKDGDLSSSSNDLREWINRSITSDDTIQRYCRKVEYELQRRQISESIEWQKWMTIATGAMAIATVILAIITLFNIKL